MARVVAIQVWSNVSAMSQGLAGDRWDLVEGWGDRHYRQQAIKNRPAMRAAVTHL